MVEWECYVSYCYITFTITVMYCISNIVSTDMAEFNNFVITHFIYSTIFRSCKKIIGMSLVIKEPWVMNIYWWILYINCRTVCCSIVIEISLNICIKWKVYMECTTFTSVIAYISCCMIAFKSRIFHNHIECKEDFSKSTIFSSIIVSIYVFKVCIFTGYKYSTTIISSRVGYEIVMSEVSICTI